MRIIAIALILLILSIAAADEPKIIGCSCDCPEVPTDDLIAFKDKTIHTNGSNETTCQDSCGGICGGTSHCGLNLGGDDCETCCNDYCSEVTPDEAKEPCKENCQNICEVKSTIIGIASMLSYIAVTIVAVIFAICGIRFLTSDDPESREASKKCILYLIIALVLISVSALIVALFTGIEIGGVGGGATGSTLLSGEYIANC